MERMMENVGAAQVTFTDSELLEIEIMGERYDPDSEPARSIRKQICLLGMGRHRNKVSDIEEEIA